MTNKTSTEDSGLHTPVSNQHEEDSTSAKVLTQQPSAGASPSGKHEPKSVENHGHEPLKGYTLRKRNQAEAAATPNMRQLHDIGEASFGPPKPIAETVHGPDDRVRIATTSTYPWSAHASLLITAADGSLWIGTGWFIGPHTLMTAGHVVFIKNSGVPGRDGWVRQIQVMPGRNGDSLPFGSVTSSNLRSVTGWTTNGDQNFDYGAIILSSDLGNSTGWFGFGVYPDADLLAAVANISGYPGDQPSGTQWYDAHQVASVDARKVYYDVDTAGGQSGSAAYRIVDGQRYGVAVHAYGGAVTNSGTRIVAPVFNNMVAWKA